MPQIRLRNPSLILQSPKAWQRFLKKGTDYSVPDTKLLIYLGALTVDRAVCPLFQQSLPACARLWVPSGRVLCSP
jgi:hypothetical protein